MTNMASRFLRYIPEDPMRGPDVREVQEKLRGFGLYVGPLDGIYGRGTYDSVIAFQARRQLVPDGIVGPATYNALGSGATPPAQGTRGPSITIDVELRQLYYSRGGRLQRIYDVAVGAPSTPTPIGRWVIVQKTMNPGGPFGRRWMRLNIPWGGYGIHGTDDESSIGRTITHGCIRLHNRDVEQLYSLVPIGTEVNIVGEAFTGRVLIPGRVSGSDVRTVQEILMSLGYYDGVTDGVYGPRTADAVLRFQRDRGLNPDAIVGPYTYDALQAAFDQQRGLTEP